MPSFKYLEPHVKRPEQRFYMAGVGLNERVEPSVVHRPHGTGDWLLMFFHTQATIEVEGRRATYPAGTMMIWDETEPHLFGNLEKRWKVSWIHCQGSIVPGALSEAGLQAGVYPDLDCAPLLVTYLPLIHRERLRADMDALILEHLFRCLLLEVGRLHAPRSRPLPPRIHALKQYLETRYREPLTLDDLCHVAHMSKPHLLSEFRRYVGMPPIGYLIRVRLGHARNLLLDHNLSVGEIAERVGYPNIYHFSKLFRKHTGRSPSAFRGRN